MQDAGPVLRGDLLEILHPALLETDEVEAHRRLDHAGELARLERRGRAVAGVDQARPQDLEPLAAEGRPRRAEPDDPMHLVGRSVPVDAQLVGRQLLGVGGLTLLGHR